MMLSKKAVNVKHSFRLLQTLQSKTRLSKVRLLSHEMSIVGTNISRMIPTPTNVDIQQKRFAAHQPHTVKTIEDRVMLIVNLYDKIDNRSVTMESNFFKDLGLDSLDFVEIIMAIEDEFRFEIPDGDSDRMHTPRDISRYICDKFDTYE